MPVIRGQARKTALTDDLRKTLLETLENELAGKPSASGTIVSDIPLIFEIPLERVDGPSDRMDVLVVWDAFDNLRSEERSALILDAYKDQQMRISQALGVTRQEAMQENLLPYSVEYMNSRPAAGVGAGFVAPLPHDVYEAMLQEGGFRVGDRLVKLMLPSRAMAEDVLNRLQNRYPTAQWGILVHPY